MRQLFDAKMGRELRIKTMVRRRTVDRGTWIWMWTMGQRESRRIGRVGLKMRMEMMLLSTDIFSFLI